MSFDPNNYNIVNDDTNLVADYENAVANTKGGTTNQILRKTSNVNHDFRVCGCR